MKLRAWILPLLLFAAAGTAWSLGYLRFTPGPVAVTEARVRLPAAPGLPAAGYFELRRFESMEVLTGVSSPAAERIELHLSSEENGISRMRKTDRVSLPRTGEFSFEPGAYHLMIFGLREGLQAGQTIPLTLTFEKAQPVTVEARLETGGGGDGGHAGH